MSKTALVVGATRGLGLEVTKLLAQIYTVYATARSPPSPSPFPTGVRTISHVDVSKPDSGATIVAGLKDVGITSVDLVIITAGLFKTETLEKPSFEDQEMMYKVVAIAPTIIVSALHNAKLLPSGGKIILVSSESGSITLRHKSEGGGNYGHHAGKAALNMVAKLLSLDLKESGVAVGVVHPGFMRTEMTKNVGFDEYWDKGGAVTPDVAAKSLVEWVEEDFGLDKTGEYWAPRGPRDIGTAEPVLGKNLPTPLRLPW